MTPRLDVARRPETPDAELIARIANGDLSGLGILFDRYGGDVRRLLLRLGIASSDADDLVQLTFLDAARAAPRFDARAAVKPWLLGVAAMVARRHRRSFGRMLDRLRTWALEPAPLPEAAASKQYELKEEARRAERALAQLSAKKRETFVLVAVEGMNGEEVAQALGIPIATVWTRLHHARRELRLALKEDAE